MKKSFLFMLLAILGLTSCGQTKQKLNMETVKTLDLNRYLGSWYEIARFDHSFERGLVGTKANYSLQPNGMIKVVNSGYKNTLDGEYKEAIGKAKFASDKNLAHLRVSFFWIFYSDYYVLELDEQNYSYAMIGSSSDKYFWILSRTLQLPKATLDTLINKAKERGYDTTKIIYVPQKTN